MKTGFIYGYPNKPVKERYGYHGVDRECLIQPDPSPFEEFPTGPPLGEWILAWEGSIRTAYLDYYRFYPVDFLSSSDEYRCPGADPGEKNLYYFAEIIVYGRGPGKWLSLSWSDGVNCKLSWISGEYKSIYKSWFNIRYGQVNPLWWVFNAYYGSYGRCWKSLDGEFPGYYPMEQKEIITPW